MKIINYTSIDDKIAKDVLAEILVTYMKMGLSSIFISEINSGFTAKVKGVEVKCQIKNGVFHFGKQFKSN